MKQKDKTLAFMEFAVEWLGKSKPSKKLMNAILTICKKN